MATTSAAWALTFERLMSAVHVQAPRHAVQSATFKSHVAPLVSKEIDCALNEIALANIATTEQLRDAVKRSIPITPLAALSEAQWKWGRPAARELDNVLRDSVQLHCAVALNSSETRSQTEAEALAHVLFTHWASGYVATPRSIVGGLAALDHVAANKALLARLGARALCHALAWIGTGTSAIHRPCFRILCKALKRRALPNWEHEWAKILPVEAAATAVALRACEFPADMRQVMHLLGVCSLRQGVSRRHLHTIVVSCELMRVELPWLRDTLQSHVNRTQGVLDVPKEAPATLHAGAFSEGAADYIALTDDGSIDVKQLLEGQYQMDEDRIRESIASYTEERENWSAAKFV